MSETTKRWMGLENWKGVVLWFTRNCRKHLPHVTLLSTETLNKDTQDFKLTMRYTIPFLLKH